MLFEAEVVGDTDAPPADQLSAFHYFPASVFVIEKPKFLDAARAVSKESLAKRKKEQGKANEIYPVYMSDNLWGDPRMEEFSAYVGQTAWNILSDQGYNMNRYTTVFTEMWCQEHYKHSGMEQHVHGFGSQITGFYFLDCPENSSRVVFHDPKAGKVQGNLPEANMANATPASNMVNFEAKPGMLIFTNSYLPHSFTRHASPRPMRFIHFNLTVQDALAVCPAPDQAAPEII